MLREKIPILMTILSSLCSRFCVQHQPFPSYNQSLRCAQFLKILKGSHKIYFLSQLITYGEVIVTTEKKKLDKVITVSICFTRTRPLHIHCMRDHLCVCSSRSDWKFLRRKSGIFMVILIKSLHLIYLTLSPIQYSNFIQCVNGMENEILCLKQKFLFWIN